jgi:hypothetical protein
MADTKVTEALEQFKRIATDLNPKEQAELTQLLSAALNPNAPPSQEGIPAVNPYLSVDVGKAQTFFREHWKLRECPVCQTHDPWVVGTNLIQVPTYVNGVLRFDLGFVLLPVYCRVCSYAMVFNAVTMGLVPAAPQV